MTDTQTPTASAHEQTLRSIEQLLSRLERGERKLKTLQLSISGVGAPRGLQQKVIQSPVVCRSDGQRRGSSISHDQALLTREEFAAMLRVGQASQAGSFKASLITSSPTCRQDKPCGSLLDVPQIAASRRVSEAASSASVFELRHSLQLVLGRVVDDVIRIPVFVCCTHRPVGTVDFSSRGTGIVDAYRGLVGGGVVVDVRTGSLTHFSLSYATAT